MRPPHRLTDPPTHSMAMRFGSNELLDRCITVGAKDGIDPCLVPGTLSLEPLKHILDAKRNGRFRSWGLSPRPTMPRTM